MEYIIIHTAHDGDGWAWGWDAIAALATFAATLTALFLPYWQRRLTRISIERAAAPAIIAELDHLIEIGSAIAESIPLRVSFNNEVTKALRYVPMQVELDNYLETITDWETRATANADPMAHWSKANKAKQDRRQRPSIPTEEATQLSNFKMTITAGLEATLLTVDALYAKDLIRTRAIVLHASEEFRLALEGWDAAGLYNSQLNEMEVAVSKIVEEARNMRSKLTQT